jgi:hypothetical protein
VNLRRWALYPAYGRDKRPGQGWGTVAALAEGQHGVVATAQLLEVGMSSDQIATRARAGWLHRVHRGVYAVGHRRLTRHGRWMAAVLAAGERAVLSDECAADLWGLVRSGIQRARSARLEVTVPAHDGRCRRPDLVIHRRTSLRADETTRHAGIPVTTPARTLLDLATGWPRRQLERAIDEADRLRLCDGEELAALAATHRGHPGRRRLAAVLRSHKAGSTLTRSELEERFLALCRARGLPPPLVNAEILGLTVDFHWPDAGLIAETDGRGSHDTRRGFQDDRDRDSLLAAHGHRTLRLTWWDVSRRPAVVADRIRRVLERR